MERIGLLVDGKRKVLLDVQGLKMWFPVTKGVVFKRTINNIKAVNNISFYIDEGETLGLVGESGCGKTTTGRCILRFNTPTGGNIWYDGENLNQLQEKDLLRFRRNVQVIFQDPYSSLNPRMKVRTIISDPMIVHKLYQTKSALNNRVDELLEMVGLSTSMADRYPHQFSGGERQRIGIARALSLNPKFIVCDEAVSALDVSIQAQIVNLFSDLQKKLNLTYLFISHDLAVVRHISDRVAVMYLGHIVEIAGKDEIYANPMHPYTKALLSAVAVPDPILEEKRTRIILSGDAPDLRHQIRGCAFQTRCPEATEECSHCAMELHEKSPGHLVACLKV